MYRFKPDFGVLYFSEHAGNSEEGMFNPFAYLLLLTLWTLYTMQCTTIANHNNCAQWLILTTIFHPFKKFEATFLSWPQMYSIVIRSNWMAKENILNQIRIMMNKILKMGSWSTGLLEHGPIYCQVCRILHFQSWRSLCEWSNFYREQRVNACNFFNLSYILLVWHSLHVGHF